jgi:hypothetical protein
VAGAEALWCAAFERHPSPDGHRTLLGESTDRDAQVAHALGLRQQRLDAGESE